MVTEENISQEFRLQKIDETMGEIAGDKFMPKLHLR